MKKRKAKPARSGRRFQRRPIMIVTAIVIVAIAAVTVVSRQSANTKTVSTGLAKAPETKVRAAAQDLQVPQSGRIRPLTQEEAEQLAQKLKGLLNKSTDGLKQVHHEDGSISMDLEGRFQNVTVARVNEDGTTTQSCVDSPKAAANFFGMDPKLLEDGKPVRPTPVN